MLFDMFSGQSTSVLHQKTRVPIAYLIFVCILCVVELFLLHLLSPRFFWTDDAQSQFAPQYWWLGHLFYTSEQRAILDPDQGIAGNLLNDPQSGALAPILWLIQSLLSLFSNVNHAAWFFALITLLATAYGLLRLMNLMGLPIWLNLSVSVCIPFSGFFLWFGSTWWPVMTSGCFFVWALGSVLSNSKWSIPTTGIFTYAMCSMGNPYIIPFFILFVVTHFALKYKNNQISRIHLLKYGLSVAGGIILSIPIYVGTLGSSNVAGRPVADSLLGNNNLNVANNWDVIFGSATTLPAISTWSGAIMLAPICATFILSTCLIPLINWSKALNDVTFMTFITVSFFSLLAAQLPSIIGPLRYPFRYLLVWQFLYPISLLYGYTKYRMVTNHRRRMAYILIGIIFITACSRTPTLVIWHFGWGVATLIALEILNKILNSNPHFQSRNHLRLFAIFSLLTLSVAGTFVSVQIMRQLNSRISSSNVQPLRPTTTGYEVKTSSISGFQKLSTQTEGTATVLNFNNNAADRGESLGIFEGNMNLVLNKKTGYGEVAVDQRYLSRHIPRDYLGNVSADSVSSLLQHAYKGYRWIDVASSSNLYISQNAPQKLKTYLNASPLWQTVRSKNAQWVKYQKVKAYPGRISVASNIIIHRGKSKIASVFSRTTGQYSISLRDSGGSGTLILYSPYWPGYSATLNGKKIKVSSLQNSLVKIHIPRSASKRGTLLLSYEPIAVKILLPFSIFGILLILFTIPFRRKTNISE